MVRNRSKVIPMLALIGALTACGSTVQSASMGAVGPDGQPMAPADGLSGDPLGAETAGPGGNAASGVAGGGSAGAPGSGVGAQSGGVTTSGSGVPGAAPDAGQGAPGAAAAPGAPIRLGITVPDTAALASAFGREPNDASLWFKKVVAYVNKNGGVAGRQINATYHKADVAEDGGTAGQKACTAFTQDTKVDFVVNAGVIGDTFPACLAKAGVSVLETSIWASDAADERRFPNRFSAHALRIDRQMASVLSVSAQRGTLKRGDTLGVLVEDCPRGARIMKSVVEPQAQKLGVTVVQGTHKCVENLAADIGPVTNDIQRETLRFRQSGVTHVIVLSFAEAFGVAQFTQNASQQRYYPKYLVTSNAYPFGNSQSDAIIKISQDALPNISGAGYLPLLDVGNLATAENPAQEAQQARCKAADPGLGISESEEGSGRYFARATYYAACDSIYVTKALLEANGVRYATGDVTQGFRTALSGKRLGASALGGGYFGAAAGRLDGVGFVRPFQYDTRRKAFVYVGGPIAQP